MPLHRIWYSPGAFSEQDKAALAENITKLYTSFGLPAFYVVVLYLPVEEKNYFVGGKKESKFVRISVQHIARHFPSNKTADQFLDKYENVLAPFIKERGLDWEISTVAEKEWVRLDKAVPYDEKDNVIG
uniref:Tautomerase cis-CaaD-like domain-containing protein n=1 Tax=Acrobeloides nanus TaxID=290746 RepID=A0A914CGE2_9BILA